MPSTSKKQAHLMAAVAHNPAFAKKVGIPQSVGKDFNSADKGRKFGSGGMAKSDMKEDMKADTKQDKAIIKKAFKMHDQQEHKGEHTNLSKLKKGGVAMKKMAKGGETMGPRTMSKDVESGSNKLTKFGQSAVQKRGMTKGTNLGDSGKTVGIQKMAKGGKVKRYDEGGYTGDDEIVKYRMGMTDKPSPSEPAIEDESDRGNVSPAAAEFNKDTGNEPSTPKAAPKAVSKPVPKAAPKAEPKTAPATKPNPVQDTKDVVSGKGASVPKSFSDAGGSSKASSSKADLSSLGFKKPSDPLARFEQTGPKRSEQNMPAKKKDSSSSTDYSVGNAMRKGGKVGPSRGDGIAQRGRTKGKYC